MFITIVIGIFFLLHFYNNCYNTWYDTLYVQFKLILFRFLYIWNPYNTNW